MSQNVRRDFVTSAALDVVVCMRHWLLRSATTAVTELIHAGPLPTEICVAVPRKRL